MSDSSGIVYLVGAGPGDAGLLTVRGRDLLASCDAVVHDALANPALLAHATGNGRTVELHDAGKRGGSAESARQDDINALLVRLGREGKRVVRLKGGDPFVFGRGSEEAQALARSGVRFEVVPGVTAGIAAPAYAGIPVTHRAVATSVTFVTGHESPDKPAATVDWAALARAGGTIVLYMGVSALPSIARALMDGGLAPDTPAAAVQWGTYSRQRTLQSTLQSLPEAMRHAGIAAPVITVIGSVASLRSEIAWFESRPLFGKRIVVTRTRAQAGRLAALLSEAGAEVVEAPATRIERLDDAPLRSALARSQEVDWLFVTSQTAVEILWETLRASGRDARALGSMRIAAVGPATAAALLDRGLAADVVPARFVAEGVLEAMQSRPDVRGTRGLYVAAKGARDVLPRGLADLGMIVERVEAYHSVPDTQSGAGIAEQLRRGEVDFVTYASASAVQSFVSVVGEAAARVPAACIGPITAAAARDAGLQAIIEAPSSTIEALVSAIEAQARHRP